MKDTLPGNTKTVNVKTIKKPTEGWISNIKPQSSRATMISLGGKAKDGNTVIIIPNKDSEEVPTTQEKDTSLGAIPKTTRTTRSTTSKSSKKNLSIRETIELDEENFPEVRDENAIDKEIDNLRNQLHNTFSDIDEALMHIGGSDNSSNSEHN